MAWGTLAPVGSHVGGVVHASARHRENFVIATITGRKNANPITRHSAATIPLDR